MLREPLINTLRSLADQPMPLPGSGETAARHRELFEIGRMDISLARLAEAHWDAVAILAEAGRRPQRGAIYGVWAAERPGWELTLEPNDDKFRMSGKKMFCSGARIVDRALVTVSIPHQQLVDVDLRAADSAIAYDHSDWKTTAFQDTQTSTAVFKEMSISAQDFIGEPRWYLERPGFWHGACGPAACWAGGAEGLLDYALRQSRSDPHTQAHLGAIHASVWAMKSYLATAGHEIDAAPHDYSAALIRALTVRHLVEQASTDILRRLTRAYGPHPLALDGDVSRRYQELDMYLRQSHAERDLEALGRAIRF